jgi:hypothetical protein
MLGLGTYSPAMPEGSEQNCTTNLQSGHGLGPVNIHADAWTSRTGTLYVVTAHRFQAEVWIFQSPCAMLIYHQNPTHFTTLTVDNAYNNQILSTRWTSGYRCLAHLANLHIRALEHQLQEQVNVSQKLHIFNYDSIPTEPHGRSPTDGLRWKE